jgi:tubulin polyglutamylase TTLL9
LKPWLIEINASPSMTANTPNDYEMKIGLLDDTFTVLDLEKM